MNEASPTIGERNLGRGKWSLVLSVAGAAPLVVLLLLPPLWPTAQASMQDIINLLDAPLTTLYILLALAVPALGFATMIIGALETIQRRCKRWLAVVGAVLGVLVTLAAYSYFWRPIISVMPL